MNCKQIFGGKTGESYCRNELNFGTLIWAWAEKTGHWLSGKEHFPGAVVNKEGYIEKGAVFLIIKDVVSPHPPLVGKVLIHHLGETLIDFFLTLQAFIFRSTYV